jgi:hypothetical protein
LQLLAAVTLKVRCLIEISLVVIVFSYSERGRCAGAEAPEGSIFFPPFLGDGTCTLPCNVELSEEDSLSNHVPYVTWFFKSKANTFVPLNDSEFWRKEYRKYYCDKTGYPFPDFRDYSGPSHFSCVRRTSNHSEASFDCSLNNHACFIGTYQCQVSLESDDDTEKKLLDNVTTEVKG